VTKRTLLLSAITAVVLTTGWLAATAATRPYPLRSQHSEPAGTAPREMVAVTDEGKLYHRPDCRYIHGPSRMESGEQAVADGYTPCTRCIKDARDR
jgi:hypothetical protein